MEAHFHGDVGATGDLAILLGPLQGDAAVQALHVRRLPRRFIDDFYGRTKSTIYAGFFWKISGRCMEHQKIDT